MSSGRVRANLRQIPADQLGRLSRALRSPGREYLFATIQIYCPYANLQTTLLVRLSGTKLYQPLRIYVNYFH